MQLLNFNTQTRKSILACSALLGALVSAPLASQAQTLTTFATFDTANSTPVGSFQYSQASGLLTSTSQYLFKYKVNNAYGPRNTDILSNLTFSGTAVGSATSLNGTSYNQVFQNITATFSAVTPVGGQTNLLTLNFSSGTLSFTAGSGAATFQANVSQAGGGPPGVSGYSSAFLDFSNPNLNNQYYQSEQFSISLSGVNSAGGGNGPVVSNVSVNNGVSSGTVNSFVADPTGTFSSNPSPASAVIPEPGTLSLLAAGVLVGGVAFRRRLRRIAK